MSNKYVATFNNALLPPSLIVNEGLYKGDHSLITAIEVLYKAGPSSYTAIAGL